MMKPKGSISELASKKTEVTKITERKNPRANARLEVSIPDDMKMSFEIMATSNRLQLSELFQIMFKEFQAKYMNTKPDDLRNQMNIKRRELKK